MKGFCWYHELSERSKENAYLNYCALIEFIHFQEFEMEEANNHIYLKNGTYADKTYGGAALLEERRLA